MKRLLLLNRLLLLKRLLLLSRLHKAVAHVFQLFSDFTGCSLELVGDLLLFGRVEDVEALTTGKVDVRNDDEEWGGRAGLGRASKTGEGEQAHRSPSMTSLTGT